MTLEKQYFPSGLNSRFEHSHCAFDSYISDMQNIIQNTRLTYCDFTNPELIINANSPKQTLPQLTHPEHAQKIGVLLIHGLLSSPNGMESLHHHFANKNYL